VRQLYPLQVLKRIASPINRPSKLLEGHKYEDLGVFSRVYKVECLTSCEILISYNPIPKVVWGERGGKGRDWISGKATIQTTAILLITV
jgi:hypothetical protein